MTGRDYEVIDSCFVRNWFQKQLRGWNWGWKRTRQLFEGFVWKWRELWLVPYSCELLWYHWITNPLQSDDARFCWAFLIILQFHFNEPHWHHKTFRAIDLNKLLSSLLSSIDRTLKFDDANNDRKQNTNNLCINVQRCANIDLSSLTSTWRCSDEERSRLTVFLKSHFIFYWPYQANFFLVYKQRPAAIELSLRLHSLILSATHLRNLSVSWSPINLLTFEIKLELIRIRTRVA